MKSAEVRRSRISDTLWIYWYIKGGCIDAWPLSEETLQITRAWLKVETIAVLIERV